MAYWTTFGSGTASTSTGTLNAPSAPATSVTGPAAVHLSWTGSPLSNGMSALGYYVTRSSGPAPTACGTLAAPLATVTCNDTGVADGTHTYTVTAVYGSWTARGAASTPAITVVNDKTPPVVTVTSVNGLPRTFPYSTNATVTSFGGACGVLTGDSTTVTPLLNGAATAPVTATCTSGTWTLTLTTALSTDGGRTLSATQADTAGNIGTTTSQTVTVDKTVPTVTINQAVAQADPTNSSTVAFTAVFSEAVSGFVNTDVTVAGTALGTKTVGITGSGPTYTVTVSGATGNGAIIASIGSSMVQDPAGNDNTASTSTDRKITLDTTPPTISSVTLTNVLTLGQAATGDTVTVTYPGKMNATTVCSTWTNTGTQTLSGTAVTVTITQNGSNDLLTVTASNCTGLAIGSIALGDYVSATTTFSGTNGRVSLTTAGVLKVRLGTGSGSATNVMAATPVYTPADGLTDLAGNALATTPFTGTSSRF